VGDETDGSTPIAVTARALAEVFKAKSGRINQALHSIGFETESDHITVSKKEGEKTVSKRKTITKLVVPSPQIWQEITRRYWFREEDSKPPECPDILRGNRWIDPQQKIDPPLPPACHSCHLCHMKILNKKVAGMAKMANLQKGGWVFHNHPKTQNRSHQGKRSPKMRS
jgi:hypothetical protein